MRTRFFASVIQFADTRLYHIVETLTFWLILASFEASIRPVYLELVKRVTFKSFAKMRHLRLALLSGVSKWDPGYQGKENNSSQQSQMDMDLHESAL